MYFLKILDNQSHFKFFKFFKFCNNSVSSLKSRNSSKQSGKIFIILFLQAKLS
ncbi:MAG: hypothetical protein LBQ24_00455 [Candidatus Peribacteria bacterium]|nr:hypothetical protein [Candidatus Peribacteria bacterium]